MRINNGGSAGSIDSIVLFPFDDHSIPFQHGVKLTLEGKQAGHGNKPVVPLGEPPAHDSEWIAYYGTVLRIDDELWMWYLGRCGTAATSLSVSSANGTVIRPTTGAW